MPRSARRFLVGVSFFVPLHPAEASTDEYPGIRGFSVRRAGDKSALVTEGLAADADAALIAEARTGCPRAFEQLVRRHAPRVHRQALWILRNEADAADVTQEALVKAHQKLDSFRGEAKFSTWLQRIVTNLALMKLRSQRRRPEASFEELLPTFHEDGHHTRSVSPFKECADLEEQVARRDVVCRAIAQLPANYQEILVLRCVQELDTQETADFLKISTNAAKLRLHRAHQALRTLLAAELGVDP